jgi:membrane protein
MKASSRERVFRVWLVWLTEPVQRWISHRCIAMAAAIAFYAAFSLSPMLVIVIAVGSFFVGQDAVQGRLYAQMRGLLGNDAAAGIQAIIANAWKADNAGSTTILSLAGVLIGATAMFSQINASLNLIWPVRESETVRENVFSVVRVRLISFGLLIGVGFLIVILLLLDTAITYIGERILGAASVAYLLANVTQSLVSFAVLVVAFAALMKFLPDAHVQWRDTVVGAVGAALLFDAGKSVFALYLAHAGMASTFGAAGSLAVVLMWVYYSTAVFLFGAELCAFAGRRRGQTAATSTRQDAARRP